MISSTRRIWLSGMTVVLAMPAIRRAAQAADIAWRFGHTAPESFPLHRRLMEAAAEVAEKSGGRMAITVTGDAQLGSAIGQLAQLRVGSLEMAAVAGQTLATAQAAAALPMTGFAWPGPVPPWPAIDGDLGQVIRDLLRDRSGLTALTTVWDFGFRVLTTSTRPVRTAADLRGLRLRTPVEPELVTLFQALKASPIAMPLSEVRRALGRHEVEGQEGLLALVLAAGFHTSQTHCALTNHVWDGHWLCANTTAWRRLPDGLKTTVADAFNAAGLRQRADQAAAAAETQATLAKLGMTIHPVEPASFRAELRGAGYYQELRRKFGEQHWDLLERHAGRLA